MHVDFRERSRATVTRTPPATLKLGWLAVAACLLAASVQPSSAQGIVRRQVRAAALLADDVFGMAAAVRIGAVRVLNATATKLEIENYKLAVDTYWEHRRKYRSERDAEHPGYLERQQKRREISRRKLKEGLESGTDLTDELNFILSELMAAGAYSAFTTDANRNSVLGSLDNRRLSADELRRISLSEGKVAGGGLVFKLDPDQILEPHWPHALDDDRFKQLREAFEDARALALADLQTDQQIRKVNQDRLLKAVGDLRAEFKAAWPSARGMSANTFYFSYQPAQKCLERLSKDTQRLIASNNPAAFDDSYRIKADTVADLMRQMMNKGFQFAVPDPGGEVVYKRLFESAKVFYNQLLRDSGV